MRLLPAAVLALVVSICAFGQTDLVTSPSSVTFEATAGTIRAMPMTLSVLSTGGTMNYIVSAASTGNWLTVTDNILAGTGWGGTTPGTVGVYAGNATGFVAGSYSGTITLTSGAASNSPLQVPVTLTVSGAPPITIQATPSSLSFAFQEGGAAPPAQNLSVSSTGGLAAFSATGPNWLTVSPSIGATPSTLSVSANPAGLSGSYSGTITLTSGTASNSPLQLPVTFAADTGLVSGGSMAQLASGGLWNTTITLVNTGTTAAQVSLNFYDDNGNALQLPLLFPRTSSNAILLESTVNQTIGAAAELVIQTAGTASQATVDGWAQLLTNGTIGGSAVFVWTPSASGAQEAVIPIETRNPSAFVLPFDCTGEYTTGVALANLSSHAVSIPVVLRDYTGASLGAAAPIQLPAYAHISFMLATSYPALSGTMGTLELDTPTGGQISALGIRAAASGAITTVPVLAK